MFARVTSKPCIITVHGCRALLVQHNTRSKKKKWEREYLPLPLLIIVTLSISHCVFVTLHGNGQPPFVSAGTLHTVRAAQWGVAATAHLRRRSRHDTDCDPACDVMGCLRRRPSGATVEASSPCQKEFKVHLRSVRFSRSIASGAPMYFESPPTGWHQSQLLTHAGETDRPAQLGKPESISVR